MNIATHTEISPELCGHILEQGSGCCTAVLTTTPQMAVDSRGLVHGGFVFGLADYAAMVAVNDPNVVLGAATVRFLKPVVVGETLEAIARIQETKGKKNTVLVEVKRREEQESIVFCGTFTCFALVQHVLD